MGGSFGDEEGGDSEVFHAAGAMEDGVACFGGRWLEDGV